jgi:competence protein ComEC
MVTGWEVIHKFPALVFSVLVGLGIWLGQNLPAAWLMPLFILSAVATTLGTLTLFLRTGYVAGVLRSLSCLVACAAIGAAKYQVDAGSDAASPIPTSGARTTIVGEIAEAPSSVGNRQRFLFQSHAVIHGDSTVFCEDKGIVTFIASGADTGITTLRYGLCIALHGTAEQPPAAGNPGEFSPRQYYNANGITFLMRVRGDRSIRILDSTGGTAWMRRIVLPLREGILDEIDRDIGGEEGEFLKGLLIGERTGLSPMVKRAFLDSGVAHILAVSGSNVAVVAMAITMVLSLLRLPRCADRTVTVGGLIVYMLITGAQPPVVRATIMAVAVLITLSLSRKVHPLNGVGLSALVMFAVDARQMFDVGFQLSFGAVLAILVLYPRLLALLPTRRRNSRLWNIMRTVYGIVAVSLAASLGTLPLTAIVFGRLSVVGFLANLVIVPASSISVVLGMITPLAGTVSPWVASTYAEVNRLVLHFTIWGAEMAASVPWATMDTVWFRPIDALPYFAGLAAVLSLRRPGRLRKLLVILLACGNLRLFWPPSSFGDISPEELRVTMIDVGQGDAFLIQQGNGRNVLIDTGPPPRDGSPWGTSVVPLLKRLGIRCIDELVITHAHDDHAGGLNAVLQSCEVKEIILDPVAVCAVHPGVLDRPPAVRVGARGKLFGDSLCRYYILSPDSLTPDSRGNANRLSVVTKLQYGRISMLFMGDAESGEEASILHRYGGFVESSVLKIGHHGSRAGTSDAFLTAVKPEFALISVGRLNRFGHPARATLQRLRNAGVEILRTDESGAVMLRSDGKSVGYMFWR